MFLANNVVTRRVGVCLVESVPERLPVKLAPNGFYLDLLQQTSGDETL